MASKIKKMRVVLAVSKAAYYRLREVCEDVKLNEVLLQLDEKWRDDDSPSGEWASSSSPMSLESLAAEAALAKAKELFPRIIDGSLDIRSEDAIHDIHMAARNVTHPDRCLLATQTAQNLIF